MTTTEERIIHFMGRYDEDHLRINFQEYCSLGGHKSFPKYVGMVASFFEYTFLAYIDGDLTKPDGTVWESSLDSFMAFAKTVGNAEAKRVFASIDNIDHYT